MEFLESKSAINLKVKFKKKKDFADQGIILFWLVTFLHLLYAVPGMFKQMDIIKTIHQVSKLIASLIR